MKVFDLSALMKERQSSRDPYLEFVRVTSMSAGIYVLRMDDRDLQTPHTEDELYYVVSGRATFRSDSEITEVGPGKILFVAANERHSFFDIKEELSLLVFFAPPEGSHASDTAKG
jgi:mannose-6-phosphate isomerase-like protein (cupin superfamily)